MTDQDPRAVTLATLSELLGCDAEALNPDEDLRDHGLDSMRLMALVDRLRVLNPDLTFADLAQHSTVNGVLDAVGDNA